MGKVLVTGAGGYIGIPLCKKLVASGHNVIALDRYFFGIEKFGRFAQDQKLDLHTCDIRSVPNKLLDEVDTVIDLAGLSNDLSAEIDPRITESINFNGCANLAIQAQKAGVRRYVFASSASVYGLGERVGLKETDACNPQTLYAKSKLHVEGVLSQLRTESFEPVIMRNATVFGLAPRMRLDLAVNIMTYRAWQDRVVYVMGGGQQWRPFVHVEDVAQALLLAAEAPAHLVSGEIFNVGDETMNYQISQIAQFIIDVIPNVTIHNIPDDPDKRTYNLNFEKVRSVLNFRPTKRIHDGVVEIKTALEKGILDGEDPTCYTLKWYKSIIEWSEKISSLSKSGPLL